MELSRYAATAVLFVLIAGCVVLVPHKAAGKAH